MMQPILSEAFQRATLKSERYRIIGLLIIISTFILLNATRVILGLSLGTLHTPEARRFISYIVFWMACGCYEALLLFLNVRASRRKRPLRSWVLIANTIIECIFPSIAALGQTLDKSYLGPYLALASGILVIYCFFIILSTLRLRPALCILAGTVSSLGYTGVYLLTIWQAYKSPNSTIYRQEVFIMNAVVLFFAGLVAAGVARQIRQHVIAALAEAETRRKLDRVEHDLQLARSIQMGLLPQKPLSVPGYDIAGWSQPADQTGGDYYDWIELPQGKILFTIADATGHGIGPALLVAACRAYFRALATRRDPLETITAQVDALLASDVPPGRFITAAVALLEPDQHRLSLYSAGHAPIYLYTASDGVIAEFESDQPPLGISMPIDTTNPPRSRILSFAPGDMLILITDGFFECADPAGDLFGTERLGQAICRHQSLPSAALIRQLHQDVLQFTSAATQHDDLTAVIIKRQRIAT